MVTTLQGEKMAKLQYTGTEQSRSLVRGGTIFPKETLTVDAQVALVYLGHPDWKITFEPLDEASIKQCSPSQSKRLLREFKGKTLDGTLNKMFKPKTKKSLLSKKTAVPRVEQPKIEPKIEPKKEGKKTKPMVLKKVLKDSEL